MLRGSRHLGESVATPARSNRTATGLVCLDMAATGIVVGLVLFVALVVVSEVTVSVAVLVGIPGAVETNMRAAGGAVVGAAHEAGNRLRVADLPACVPEGTRALTADGVLPAVVGALGFAGLAVDLAALVDGAGTLAPVSDTSDVVVHVLVLGVLAVVDCVLETTSSVSSVSWPLSSESVREWAWEVWCESLEGPWDSFSQEEWTWWR